MKTPTNLNLRQTLEGVPLIFNPAAAEGLETAIQFDVTGDEPGIYHLSIADGECTFHTGPATSPNLTITTPSDVWLAVSNGDISGQDALMQGQYQASGDLSLLLKMDSLFGTVSDASFEAPRSQRPAGPLPLSGMAWMAVAFIPWMIFWITFDIPGVSRWISIGLPLLLSALIVGYRLIFNRPTGGSADNSLTQPPTLFEWGGLGFFAVASLFILIGSAGFSDWGSVISSLVMGGLWLGSLLFSRNPLSADYSR
ncbi:MAG: SCP2 sterol-binding domain-containing protein [Chloroflexi bacterium]|nr:SCP2 sterol-binding domain-containing protein [Chloroflexota bacterium]